MGLSTAFLCNGAQMEEKRVTQSSGGRDNMFGGEGLCVFVRGRVAAAAAGE